MDVTTLLLAKLLSHQIAEQTKPAEQADPMQALVDQLTGKKAEPKPTGIDALLQALTGKQDAKPDAQPDMSKAIGELLAASQAKSQKADNDNDVMAKLVQAIQNGANNGTGVPSLAPSGLPLTHSAIGGMSADQINAAWDKVIAPQVV